MRARNWTYLAGQCLQGLTLGILLFMALLILLEMHGAARLFRYQGF